MRSVEKAAHVTAVAASSTPPAANGDVGKDTAWPAPSQMHSGERKDARKAAEQQSAILWYGHALFVLPSV